jgi:hypothetical protein
MYQSDQVCESQLRFDRSRENAIPAPTVRPRSNGRCTLATLSYWSAEITAITDGQVELLNQKLTVADERLEREDTVGVGDTYVQPINLDWQTNRADFLAAYEFDASTGSEKGCLTYGLMC